MKYFIIFFILFSISLSAQVRKYTAATVYLRDGSVKKGELKIDKFATKILFQENETGTKHKYTARELDYAKVNDKGIITTISFKILNGKGKGPKIVQHITEGSVSLYKKLDQDHDYYKPIPPKKSYNFTNPFDPLNNTQISSSQNIEISSGAIGFSLLYALAIKNEKIWFYGKQRSDIVDILPKKRNDIMRLFNNCPQAMKKFKNVENKDFDFVYFLNYYNVECASN